MRQWFSPPRWVQRHTREHSHGGNWGPGGLLIFHLGISSIDVTAVLSSSSPRGHLISSFLLALQVGEEKNRKGPKIKAYIH